MFCLWCMLKMVASKDYGVILMTRTKSVFFVIKLVFLFSEENKPIVVFNKVLELYEQQFTPRWLGVMGDEHAPR